MPNSYRVNLTSLSVTTPAGISTSIYAASSRSAPLNALVDTGVTYTFLPAAVVEAVASRLDAWREVGEWKVDCALRDAAGTVDFGFGGGLVIRVPYADLLLRVGDGTCSLGVQSREGEEEGDSILGDTFLRGAYGEFFFPSCTCAFGVVWGGFGFAGVEVADVLVVVYDQVSHNVWMANHEDCGSEVAEVGKRVGDPGDLKGLC